MSKPASRPMSSAPAVLTSTRPIAPTSQTNQATPPPKAMLALRRATRSAASPSAEIGLAASFCSGLIAYELGERAEGDPDRAAADREVARIVADRDRAAVARRVSAGSMRETVSSSTLVTQTLAAAGRDRLRVAADGHLGDELVRGRIDHADRVG